MNDLSQPSRLARLLVDLADLKPELDPERLERISKDFGWFSPITEPLLRDKRADAAFAPATEADIVRIG